MCRREIFAVRYRLADAAERVGGTTLDDAKDFLWTKMRRVTGKTGINARRNVGCLTRQR